MNQLTESLREIFANDLTGEKILLAPSRRIGRMWLRRVVASGQPAVNVRIETFSSLAMRIVGPRLHASGRKLLPHELTTRLIELNQLGQNVGQWGQGDSDGEDDREGGKRADAEGSGSSGGSVSGKIPDEGQSLWDLTDGGVGDAVGDMMGGDGSSSVDGDDAGGSRYDAEIAGGEPSAAAGAAGAAGSADDSASFAASWARGLGDLRSALVTPADLTQAGFETSRQGLEVISMLAAYHRQLGRCNYVDRSELLAMAAGSLEAGVASIGDGRIITTDEFQNLWTGDMWLLWRALDQSRCCVAACDMPTRPPSLNDSYGGGNAARISAALAGGQKQVELFRASGTDSEIRYVLRYCAANNIPLDTVELLYTRSAVHLPAIHSQWASAMGRSDGITYLEGLPVGLSRPGRLVSKWCKWLTLDYDQATLSQMLRDGLFKCEAEADASVLAQLLDSLGIYFGRQRRHQLLEAAINAQADYITGYDDADADFKSYRAARSRRLEMLSVASELTEQITPADNSHADNGFCRPAELLRQLIEILNNAASCHGRFDNNARQRIVGSLELLGSWYSENPAGSMTIGAFVDIVERTLESARADARGPQPGCLFAAPVSAGGYSGREHKFVIGLNDEFFGGSDYQDPLLDDVQRQRISDVLHKTLPLSWHVSYWTAQQFISLLARSRGRLYLGFSEFDIASGAELSPAAVLLSAAAAISSQAWADAARLRQLCGSCEQFLPASAAAALDGDRLRLSDYACSSDELREYAAGKFPQLVAGSHWRQQCDDASSFNAASGSVEAISCDSRREFSPSSLEMLAGCPRRFFFRYLLGLKPPETQQLSYQYWLDRAQFGTLVHNSFCQFYRQWQERFDSPADMNLDGSEDFLRDIMDSHIAHFKTIVPPVCDNAYNATVDELYKSAGILLASDRRLFASGDFRPWALEASIGLPPEVIEPGEGASPPQPTPLDRAEAVEIHLNSGTLKIRGRLDRVDRNVSDGSLAIWDYKTGSTAKFEQHPPFNQGRVLQMSLYPRMLLAAQPQANVQQVGYYFIGLRGRGRMISYQPDELRTASPSDTEILEILFSLIADGCYTATDNDKDCTYCDYRDICGDVKAEARISRQRLKSSGDPRLEGFKRLRLGDKNV